MVALGPPEEDELAEAITEVPMAVPTPCPFFFFYSVIYPFHYCLGGEAGRGLPLYPPLFFRSLSYGRREGVLGPFILRVVVQVR